MLSNNISYFDILDNQETPYSGFKGVLNSVPEREQRFNDLAEEAIIRIQNGFNVELSNTANCISILESIIAVMWQEGWDPNNADVDLFATDFGSVLTRTIQNLFYGRLVFRSDRDISHLSIWWPGYKIEVFPLHKVYKRLMKPIGESIEVYVNNISQKIK